MPYHGYVKDPRGGYLWTCHHQHRTLGAAKECSQRELRRNAALTTALDAACLEMAHRVLAQREQAERRAEREKAEAEQAQRGQAQRELATTAPQRTPRRTMVRRCVAAVVLGVAGLALIPALTVTLLVMAAIAVVVRAIVRARRDWHEEDVMLGAGILHPDVTITRRTTHRQLTKWCGDPARFVPHASLDDPSRELLAAATCAVLTIARSAEFRAGSCGAVQVADLRWHQWEIAAALRDITGLRAQLPSSAGPLAAPVMAAQKDAVAVAEAATTSRIDALKCYAEQVTQADAARRDWEDAQEIATRNDAYRALVARTAADEHATAGLADLATQASALQAVLADASLAAEVLALRPAGEPASR
jgi:hypothetical protein